MRGSFVIVNYNRKEELLKTLAKTTELIGSDTAAFEIIVIDNASADGSADAVAAAFPKVILIRNPENTGVTAWNAGFAKARGEYFIVLDDDSHVERGLNDALDYLDRNESVGVLALNVQGGLYQTYEWDDMSERAGFIGCGAVIRKKVYEKIGGFADWIFIYTHEWEFGIRVLQAGFKIIYFEKCVVKHRASVINRTSKRLVVFSVAHEMAIVYKYFPEKRKSLYLQRVFLNNLKQGLLKNVTSLPWYFEAYKLYLNLKKKLQPSPINKSVQDLFTQQVWKTKPFLRIY